MPRSYFRTLPDLYERKVFGTDTHPPYSPAQFACFQGTLCFAEQQPQRGRFKSRKVLAALLEGPTGLGRMIARQIEFLIAQGDLVPQPDGSLYVEGWDELQEGNWQVAERMQRYRARKSGVTPTVTPPVTVGVTPTVTDDPSRVDGEGRRAVSEGHMAVTDPVVAYMKLTGTGRPVKVIEDKLRANAERYGHDEWLFAVNQARDLYGWKNDIKNAEGIAEERYVSRQQDAKRRREAEIEATRVSPEQAVENQRRIREETAKLIGKGAA